jgi:hypothetical protein
MSAPTTTLTPDQLYQLIKECEAEIPIPAPFVTVQVGPLRPVNVGVHAGAVPLPGRVEVRNLHDAAQVASAVRITAGLAVPLVLPVHWLQVLRCTAPLRVSSSPTLCNRVSCRNHVSRRPLSWRSSEIPSQRTWPIRSASRDGGSPSSVGRSGRSSLTMPRQGTQVPLADRHRSCHGTPAQGNSGCAGLAIRRTSDGRFHARPQTLDSIRPNDGDCSQEVL